MNKNRLVSNEFLIIFTISVADFVQCQCIFFRAGVSPIQQRDIIYQHNYLRYLINNGTVLGQPRSNYLPPLRYDRKLAYVAQIAANTCKFIYHNFEDERWDSIGQNMAEGGATFINSEPEWNRVIQTWFDEHRRYPNINNRNTRNFDQMASANVRYVGCGYTYFYDNRYKVPGFVKLYVCYYGSKAPTF